jgi:ribosomal protein S18 acetylase RimI-like enzyme
VIDYDDVVILLHAPEIPSLKFRPYRGEIDLCSIVQVFNACKTFDGLEQSVTVRDVERYFIQHIPAEHSEHITICEVNGKMIAFSFIYWETKASGDWIYNFSGYLVPEWRGKGIGKAMLRHCEKRLRSYADEHPADVPKYFQRVVPESLSDLSRLLLNEGYQVVRYHYSMIRRIGLSLPDAPMPAGLQVRSVDEKDYRKVWDANQEAFAENWWHRAANEMDYEHWKSSPWFNPKLWKVAWEGDQVAGMVLNYINANENREYNRKRGYTEEICVRKPWRKRGLARSLLVQSIHMFREMGFDETALGVDADNESGALRLYRSVGYEIANRSLTYRKPLS